MCQVALPAVRDEFMGSGTGQSLQESQSVNDVFYLRCVCLQGFHWWNCKSWRWRNFSLGSIWYKTNTQALLKQNLQRQCSHKKKTNNNKATPHLKTCWVSILILNDSQKHLCWKQSLIFRVSFFPAIAKGRSTLRFKSRGVCKNVYIQ